MLRETIVISVYYDLELFKKKPTIVEKFGLVRKLWSIYLGRTFLF